MHSNRNRNLSDVSGNNEAYLAMNTDTPRDLVLRTKRGSIMKHKRRLSNEDPTREIHVIPEKYNSKLSKKHHPMTSKSVNFKKDKKSANHTSEQATGQSTTINANNLIININNQIPNNGPSTTEN